MTTKYIIQQIIAEAIDELNNQRPKDNQLENSAGTFLFGNKGSLDSLGLISLVTTVEQLIEDKLGITAALLEDIDLLGNKNPFQTVQTFADYIASVLEKKQN